MVVHSLLVGVHSAPRSTAWNDSQQARGALLAQSLFIMQIKANLMKWIAGSVLIATTAGMLSGCYVETRPRHHYYRPVVIVR